MLYLAKSTQQAKQLSKRFREHKVRRIHRGVYTDDLTTPVEQIVRRYWMDIVSHVVSHGVLSHHTAEVLKPLPFKGNYIVFLTSTYAKTLHLPGLIVKVYRGENDKFVEPLLPMLARSNRARRLLENLSTVRGASYIGVKTMGVSGVEKVLTHELQRCGEPHVNRIRDEAKLVAKQLNWHKAYQKLNQMISALLSTHSEAQALTTSYAKAMAQKKTYDDQRIKRFDELIIYLKQCCFLRRQYSYRQRSFKNLSFYEAYFSNFIEGTEFMIDEAEDIVFKGVEIHHRHADSHDVLASFMMTNDYSEMTVTPQTVEQFIDILKNRHAMLMKERPEKRPGEFKQKPNKAGNTVFVSPDNTLGTLYQGFERYRLLNAGLEKALFMQFLISEVHPFDDGNGRLARVMMNAELASHDDFKIVMPSVHRDNYLNGLRLASRDGYFRTYVKVMDQAHAYTASIPWEDYGAARERIEKDSANLTPDEGIPAFNRALRALSLSEIPA